MRPILTLITCCVLAGCATTETTRGPSPDISLPAMKHFATPVAKPPMSSNAQIARDFIDLTFRSESGRKIPRFTRFEGPITVSVAGAAPASLSRDLDLLLRRLQREAGLQISRASAGAPASITIVPMTKAQIQTAAPTAACFVRPGVSSWKEFLARRNDPSTKWSQLTSRTRMAVFLPVDVSPQETRDCLHEEIAQSLGPVNDLYRLTDSVFNDDNFHSVLTGFDMLILRTVYDPALRNGMRPSDVAAKLPGILVRLNPRGQSMAAGLTSGGNASWQSQISRAANPRIAKPDRRAAAERAVKRARVFGANDPRLAYSYYLLGRLSLSDAPEVALTSFLKAGQIYERRSDTRVQKARVAMQVAAFQLSAGRADVVINLVDQNLAAVTQAENAALLAHLLLIKAEAHDLQNRPREAARIRSEALAWARYGFGSDAEVRKRVAEILAISPRSRRPT